MNIFPFFRKKPRQFFSTEDTNLIVEAIRTAEKNTSGEIRVFVESRNQFVDAIDRAQELFVQLKMGQTQHRNGVLVYVAVIDRQVAVYGDSGIHQRVGKAYWDQALQRMLQSFSGNHIPKGIVDCVLEIGSTLSKEFPYQAETDRNELPDEIVFGQ